MQQHDRAALDAAFRLTLDLADVTEHQGWRAARDQALAALAAGPGLVALLGPAGTGKTLLLRELARSRQATGCPCQLIGRGDLPFDAGPGEVVLVDECARMDPAALDRLCASGGAAVLADLPDFEEQLNHFAAAATTVRLAPLRTDEVGAFVADRLARAGQPSDMLTADAVEALALHSAGVPRVLNLLARAALFMAAREGVVQVERRHVDLAVELREGVAPEAGGLGSEAEALAPVWAVDSVVTTVCEVVNPERPVAVLECPAKSVPVPRFRIRVIRHGATLLAASILLAAALVAWRSFGPHLAHAASTALAVVLRSAPEQP